MRACYQRLLLPSQATVCCCGCISCCCSSAVAGKHALSASLLVACASLRLLFYCCSPVPDAREGKSGSHVERGLAVRGLRT